MVKAKAPHRQQNTGLVNPWRESLAFDVASRLRLPPPMRGNPTGKLHGVVEKFAAESAEGQVRCGEHDHGAQDRQIHEVDDD